MSRWLQAARAHEPRFSALLTKDKTDTTDEPPLQPAAEGDLSVTENQRTDETTINFQRYNSDIEVSSVSSVLSGGVNGGNLVPEVSSVDVSAAAGEGIAAIETPSPSRLDYPPGAVIHLSRHRPKLDANGRPIRQLPTHPATCAICGEADWLVGMTDKGGRTLHVRCWKAKGGTS